MRCSRCKLNKPESEFYTHPETGKPMYYCKECLKKYNKERLDPEKAREYQRAYYLKHRKPRKKYNLDKNSAIYKEYMREYKRNWYLKKKGKQ